MCSLSSNLLIVQNDGTAVRCPVGKFQEGFVRDDGRNLRFERRRNDVVDVGLGGDDQPIASSGDFFGQPPIDGFRTSCNQDDIPCRMVIEIAENAAQTCTPIDSIGRNDQDDSP